MTTSPSGFGGTMARRETAVRVYQHARQLVEDQAAMAGYGYEVLAVTMWRPRSGYWRLILLGFIFAYTFPPRPELIVTYGRWIG